MQIEEEARIWGHWRHNLLRLPAVTTIPLFVSLRSYWAAVGKSSKASDSQCDWVTAGAEKQLHHVSLEYGLVRLVKLRHSLKVALGQIRECEL